MIEIQHTDRMGPRVQLWPSRNTQTISNKDKQEDNLDVSSVPEVEWAPLYLKWQLTVHSTASSRLWASICIPFCLRLQRGNCHSASCVEEALSYWDSTPGRKGTQRLSSLTVLVSQSEQLFEQCICSDVRSYLLKGKIMLEIVKWVYLISRHEKAKTNV